jgi:hypothetical protein
MGGNIMHAIGITKGGIEIKFDAVDGKIDCNEQNLIK